MKKLNLTGIALAVGAAAMFAAAPVLAEEAAASTNVVKCQGANACAGKGKCKSHDNACAGKNKCKGKGVVPMNSKEDCEAAKGTVVE